MEQSVIQAELEVLFMQSSRVVVGPNVRLGCLLSWDPEDPVAVTMVIDDNSERRVEWLFGRDLLMEGLIGEAGMGDVVIKPLTARMLMITLRSPSGMANLALDANIAEDFLNRTFDRCPNLQENCSLAINEVLEELSQSE